MSKHILKTMVVTQKFSNLIVQIQFAVLFIPILKQPSPSPCPLFCGDTAGPVTKILIASLKKLKITGNCTKMSIF